MEVKHAESFFKSAGSEACYVDCIIRLAEDIQGLRHTLANIGRALDIGIDSGAVYFNTDYYSDKNNFTVKDAGFFLSKLTGKKYEARHEKRDYKLKSGEYAIKFKALSENNGKMGIGHFIYGEYDPLENSNTSKNGFVYSIRVFKEIKR